MFAHSIFKATSKNGFDIIRTACAMAAIRSITIGSPVKFLITDDAPNFSDLIPNHQLCWVHEIRKYKLCEVFKKIESETLEKLIKEWRGFYKLIKRFKNNQSNELRIKVRAEFNRICSKITLVKPLDGQLKRTFSNKKQLLLFFKIPSFTTS